MCCLTYMLLLNAFGKRSVVVVVVFWWPSDPPTVLGHLHYYSCVKAPTGQPSYVD